MKGAGCCWRCHGGAILRTGTGKVLAFLLEPLPPLEALAFPVSTLRAWWLLAVMEFLVESTSPRR